MGISLPCNQLHVKNIYIYIYIHIAAEENNRKAIQSSLRQQGYDPSQPGFPTYLLRWAHISELREVQQQQHLLLVVSHRGTSLGSGRTWTLPHLRTFGRSCLFPFSLSISCKIPLSHHPPEPLFWTCHSAVNVEGRRSENLLSFWHMPAVICTRATQRRTQNNWKRLLASEWEAWSMVLIDKANSHIMVTVIIIYSYYLYAEEHQAPQNYVLCKTRVKRKGLCNLSINQGSKEMHLLRFLGGTEGNN